MAEDETGGMTISPAEAKISEIIKDLSTEASFSAEAMRQFMELRDECSSQESTIRYLRKHNTEKDEEIAKHKVEIRGLEGQVESMEHERDGWRKREGELIDREKQITKMEVTMACDRQRVEDHQNMVGLVFRNTELRTKFVGQEMHHSPGCIEIKDEYGNIKQYAEAAGYVGVPVEKVETETKE